MLLKNTFKPSKSISKSKYLEQQKSSSGKSLTKSEGARIKLQISKENKKRKPSRSLMSTKKDTRANNFCFNKKIKKVTKELSNSKTNWLISNDTSKSNQMMLSKRNKGFSKTFTLRRTRSSRREIIARKRKPKSKDSRQIAKVSKASLSKSKTGSKKQSEKLELRAKRPLGYLKKTRSTRNKFTTRFSRNTSKSRSNSSKKTIKKNCN